MSLVFISKSLLVCVTSGSEVDEDVGGGLDSGGKGKLASRVDG